MGVEVSKAGQASGLWSMTDTVRWLYLDRSAGVQQGMDSDRMEWQQMAPSSVTVLGRCREQGRIRRWGFLSPRQDGYPL